MVWLLRRMRPPQGSTLRSDWACVSSGSGGARGTLGASTPAYNQPRNLCALNEEACAARGPRTPPAGSEWRGFISAPPADARLGIGLSAENANVLKAF
ncbi:unnamed protein product [Arctogadus glacialis]